MTPLELADRIEAATGPSFALDTEIAYAINHPLEGLAKPYTASLDAAMSLVPEGWLLELTTTGFKPGVSLIAPLGSGPKGIGSYAATPALALCAAALRAHARHPNHLLSKGSQS